MHHQTCYTIIYYDLLFVRFQTIAYKTIHLQQSGKPNDIIMVPACITFCALLGIFGHPQKVLLIVLCFNPPEKLSTGKQQEQPKRIYNTPIIFLANNDFRRKAKSAPSTRVLVTRWSDGSLRAGLKQNRFFRQFRARLLVAYNLIIATNFIGNLFIRTELNHSVAFASSLLRPISPGQ